MKTYWDLSEEERGTLTREDVERYVDAELMVKGVLKVKPLVLEPEPAVPEPTQGFFVIRLVGGYGNKAAVVFRSVEDARAFLALRPFALESEWLSSSTVEYVSEIRPEAEVVEMRLLTDAERNAARTELSKAAAIKSENAKRKDAYEKAVREQTTALKGLWEDWHACREKVAKLETIRATFTEYRLIAGDPAVAATFLRKVYSADEIAEALPRLAEPVLAGAAE